MGIYIPNMKIPKYTTKAEFGIDADGNPLFMVYHEDGTEPDIYDVVPLPEGHGQLGDLDEMMEYIKNHEYELKSRMGCVGKGMFNYQIKEYANNHTIIPAEGETDDVRCL